MELAELGSGSVLRDADVVVSREAARQVRLPAERRELEAFQRGVNAFLVTPENTEAIKDYPEKRNDRKDYLLRDRR